MTCRPHKLCWGAVSRLVWLWTPAKGSPSDHTLPAKLRCAVVRRIVSKTLLSVTGHLPQPPTMSDRGTEKLGSWAKAHSPVKKIRDLRLGVVCGPTNCYAFRIASLPWEELTL